MFRRSIPQITNASGVILRKQLLKGGTDGKILEKHGFDAPLLRHD
jgi:hypothetical protein